MKKSIALVLSLFLMLSFVLAGCSDSKSSSPSETLLKSIEKAADIKSYSLSGSLAIKDLNLPEEVLAEEGASQAVAMLQNAELSWSGAYRADPMLIELTLKISLSGDLAMSFQIPLIMNQDKMWIKVPNIPMLELPEDIVGKFIEFDLKKLAEEQGTEWPGTMDINKSMEFGKEIYGVIFKNIDEKTYLSSPSVKDAGIPEGKDVKKVVQLHVTKDQFEPFVNAVVEKIGPQVLDLIAGKQEYLDMAQLTKEDIEDAKKELADVDSTDVKEAMDEFNKVVKSFDITSNMGINKDGYTTYTDMTIKANIEDEGQSGGGTISMVSEQSDINGDPKFEYGEPKAEDVISMDELSEVLGGLYF
ncbi:hypothetical protein [Cohnella sp. AR92]|uniref:hypothetical protein n=1 Tax=Cohnella sp. AR92 TaxID=648716 RepID=UPI000F8C3A76|nr:hypothetical protein [Cohnella sp. AR92]RUS47504.1 hypothetical protein ELR57_10350 [Cohnella sp. AR92]